MIEKYALIKALKKILKSPRDKFSVRELARQAGLSANAANYSLNFMHKNNMVTLEKIGRTYQYRANLDNYLARQWKVLFSIQEIAEAGIVEKILQTNKKIISVVLYGSCATGLDNDMSDIDILVIAQTDQKGKKSIFSQAEGTKREINISVYSPSEWREKADKQKAFYETVVIDSIALYGEKPVVL
jgi:predicted nucleotidyltransferase